MKREPRIGGELPLGERDLRGVSTVLHGYRLFMARGMGHCGGGAGPNSFDAVEALERWVEEGKAPDQLRASLRSNGKVIRTRPLCPFPQAASYIGSGSIDQAENFVCRAP